ncbi:MAG: hypothetical protein V9G14_02925 [Cypionkella sp.]
MEQRSEEWFAERKGRVTASMVGAILGLSPNLSRAGAMRRMVRDAHGAEPEFFGNIATQYGERNEDGAVDRILLGDREPRGQGWLCDQGRLGRVQPGRPHQ